MLTQKLFGLLVVFVELQYLNRVLKQTFARIEAESISRLTPNFKRRHDQILASPKTAQVTSKLLSVLANTSLYIHQL